MKKNLISIIVPCFKVSDFLPDTFKSLENQTYKNVELIFVNDGSPDDCLIKIQKFCDGKANCKIINQKNAGVSSARNAGLSIAEGEFIYFYDPDDFLAPNLLKVLYENMTKNDCQLAICDYKRVRENYKCKYKVKNKKYKYKEYSNTEDCICQLLSMNVFFTSVWNKLYSHDILKKLETYPNVFDKNIHYGEDTVFNFQYMQKIQNAIFVDEKLYFYRMQKNSAVHSKINHKILSEEFGLDKIIEICQKQYPKAVKYALGFKCVYCTDVLYKIHKSEYDNNEKTQQLYNFLKENANQLRKGKLNPTYRRLFMWTVLIYFKIVLRKRLKNAT